LITIAEAVEKELTRIKKPLRVAVMGCAVNGPGEARDADIGIACGKGNGVLFKKGQIITTVREADIISILMQEIEKL
jgi:(E)-4-hydroxy-3-methylbut-2-enyl-diphosphate synthase